jgi:hypothetical protein
MNEFPVGGPGSREPDLPRKPYTTPRLVTYGSIRDLTQVAADGQASLIPPT